MFLGLQTETKLFLPRSSAFLDPVRAAEANIV